MHARLCHSEAERGGGIFPTRACRARQNKSTTEPPRHRGKHKSFLYDSVSPSILPFRSRMSLCSFQGAFRRAVSNLFRTALAVGFGTRRRQIALEPSACFTACPNTTKITVPTKLDQETVLQSSLPVYNQAADFQPQRNLIFLCENEMFLNDSGSNCCAAPAPQ